MAISYGSGGMYGPYGQQPPQPMQGQQGLLGGIQNWFQSNPQAISALAAGLLSGSSTSDAMAQGFAGYSRGASMDREGQEKEIKRRAVTDYIRALQRGEPPAEETLAYFTANPDAGQDYIKERLAQKPKKYGFMNADGTVIRTDETLGTAEPVYKPTQEPHRVMTPDEMAQWNITGGSWVFDGKKPVQIQDDGLLSPEQMAQKRELAEAGRTSITIGEDGSRPPPPPPGQVYATKLGPDGTPVIVMEPDPSGKFLRPRLINIAGGKPDLETAEAVTQGRVAEETAADKAGTMLDAVGGIKESFKDANTPVTGTLSVPFAMYSGSPAGRVRSYVGTLQSGVALQAMLRLKQASSTGATGFGAMNQKELQLLIDDIGALNPDTTEPDIFMKTIDRIEGRYQRIIADIQRNVAPERIRELGLDRLIGGMGAAQPPPRVVGTPAQPTTLGGPPAVYEWSPDSGLRPTR